MAVKDKLKRRPLEDPAVSVAMGGTDPGPLGTEDSSSVSGDPLYGRMAAQARRARRMTPAQRKQAQRDQARNKKTYDLPEGITSQVELLAEQHGIPPSHLVALLLKQGLQAVEDGQLDIREYKVRSPVPRYEWFLDMDEEQSDQEE